MPGIGLNAMGLKRSEKIKKSVKGCKETGWAKKRREVKKSEYAF